MKIRASTLVNVFLGVALVVSIVANFTGAVDYDPWLDVNDDGYGGIDDIVSTAEHFGASGNPEKLCNITNWPESIPVTVWYEEAFSNGATDYSTTYSADGFSYMHILVDIEGLSGDESVEFRVRSIIYGPLGGQRPVICHSFIYNASLNEHAIFIPVPSDHFSFYLKAGPTTTSSISISFYLTWA